MSLSSSGPPPRIEDWTREDVRHWLISEVKVNQTCADKFFNEDVSGDFLVEFTKKEILDLDIKHGPAVKITHYLKQLKKEPTHNPQYPAYVQTWTKEQVNQWLLQHVKLYGKFTQQLLDEEVSGECLICFEKQDFKDLDIKQGPAVKILAELGRLKDKPEPLLQPVVCSSANKEAKETCAQSVLGMSLTVKEPESQEKPEQRSKNSPQTPQNEKPNQQPSASKKKQTNEVKTHNTNLNAFKCLNCS